MKPTGKITKTAQAIERLVFGATAEEAVALRIKLIDQHIEKRIDRALDRVADALAQDEQEENSEEQT